MQRQNQPARAPAGFSCAASAPAAWDCHQLFAFTTSYCHASSTLGHMGAHTAVPALGSSTAVQFHVRDALTSVERVEARHVDSAICLFTCVFMKHSTVPRTVCGFLRRLSAPAPSKLGRATYLRHLSHGSSCVVRVHFPVALTSVKRAEAQHVDAAVYI